MSLYDDFDVKTRATENVQGWSSGIKLLQSQLQLKKAAVTQPKREQQRKVTLPPVIDLKSKKDEEDIYPNLSPAHVKTKIEPLLTIIPSTLSNFKQEYDWNVIDEYDPLWPNEYEKVVKELRESRDRDNEKEEKRRERRRKTRFNDPEEEAPTPQISLPPVASGFAGRWVEEEEELEPPPKASRVGSGAAIAPPLSLQEPADAGTPPKAVPPSSSSSSSSSTYGGSSVAAKIMAKYGFKEGQGLGKQEQGMSMALQVEKTSKRGGRIIHEKEIMPPPPSDNSPKSEPSITEMMKAPSKVSFKNILRLTLSNIITSLLYTVHSTLHYLI